MLLDGMLGVEWYVCPCVYVCMCVHAQTHVRIWSQRLASDVFAVTHPQPYGLRQGLSLNQAYQFY